MPKYFITSDVHNFKSLLCRTLKKKGFDKTNPEHKLVLCGDLFDRGTEAKALFRLVKSLGDNFIYVRGNHEDLLMLCLRELYSGYSISPHHWYNSTMDTILQLSNSTRAEYNAKFYSRNTDEYAKYIKKIKKYMAPVVDFINNKSVDYFEFGNYICVHGWLPAGNIEYATANRDAWSAARWVNGMEEWKLSQRLGTLIPNKTVICGHWHCSFGNSHYHLDKHLKEWPNRSRKNWKASFEPFIDDGIIAIDACTAYSGLMNVVVINY